MNTLNKTDFQVASTVHDFLETQRDSAIYPKDPANEGPYLETMQLLGAVGKFANAIKKLWRGDPKASIENCLPLLGQINGCLNEVNIGLCGGSVPKDQINGRVGYSMLGMSGEAGEFVDLVVDPPDGPLEEDLREARLAELGDVLWYVQDLAAKDGSNIIDLLERNTKKIQGRMQAGTIKGDGDKR